MFISIHVDPVTHIKHVDKDQVHRSMEWWQIRKTTYLIKMNRFSHCFASPVGH